MVKNFATDTEDMAKAILVGMGYTEEILPVTQGKKGSQKKQGKKRKKGSFDILNAAKKGTVMFSPQAAAYFKSTNPSLVNKLEQSQGFKTLNSDRSISIQHKGNSYKVANQQALHKWENQYVRGHRPDLENRNPAATRCRSPTRTTTPARSRSTGSSCSSCKTTTKKVTNFAWPDGSIRTVLKVGADGKARDELVLPPQSSRTTTRTPTKTPTWTIPVRESVPTDPDTGGPWTPSLGNGVRPRPDPTQKPLGRLEDMLTEADLAKMGDRKLQDWTTWGAFSKRESVPTDPNTGEPTKYNY